MSFNPQLGEAVAHKRKVLFKEETPNGLLIQLYSNDCEYPEDDEVSYWIPIEEATLLRSTFEDAKELIRTWVRLRYDMEIRGELPDQLDALAKKLGY